MRLERTDYPFGRTWPSVSSSSDNSSVYKYGQADELSIQTHHLCLFGLCSLQGDNCRLYRRQNRCHRLHHRDHLKEDRTNVNKKKDCEEKL